MRLTLPHVCVCLCILLFIRSHSFHGTCRAQCNAYIQTRRNKLLFENRLQFRSMVGFDDVRSMCTTVVCAIHTDQRYSVSAHLNADTINNIRDACEQSKPIYFK